MTENSNRQAEGQTDEQNDWPSTCTLTLAGHARRRLMNVRAMTNYFRAWKIDACTYSLKKSCTQTYIFNVLHVLHKSINYLGEQRVLAHCFRVVTTTKSNTTPCKITCILVSNTSVCEIGGRQVANVTKCYNLATYLHLLYSCQSWWPHVHVPDDARMRTRSSVVWPKSALCARKKEGMVAPRALMWTLHSVGTCIYIKLVWCTYHTCAWPRGATPPPHV